MHPVPRWGLVSSLAAPVLLIGGWTMAAAVQPGSFDPMVRTISDLAAQGTPNRSVMTTALACVGLAHLATACALGAASTGGRLLHGFGGVATLMVAAFPVPADGRSSSPHAVAAAVAFISLAVWPAFAWALPLAPGQTVATLLAPKVSATATCTLLLAVAWLYVEQVTSGQRVGLAERVVAGAQALWPLAVVLSVRRAQGHPQT